MEDRRCKLGLAGRLQLVRLIESGCSLRTAAAESSVSPATAHRWWHRWRQASEAERASLACLRTRSSRPRSCPWALSAEAEQAILEARARTNLGPARLAGSLRRPRSTIWKVLWRHGVSRRRRSAPRQTFRRYEWAQPGALLHIDTKQLARFERPGHWAHGDRSGHGHDGPGTSYALSVVDDHTRLAYSELHGAESAAAAAATLRRAIGWIGEQGCGPVEAVMTDNASPTAAARLPDGPGRARAPATSSSRPTRRAGTARSSASTRPSTTNGRNRGSGPTTTPATAP